MQNVMYTLFFSYSSERAPDPEISSKRAVLSFGFFIAIDSTAPWSLIIRSNKGFKKETSNLEHEKVFGFGVDSDLLQLRKILLRAHLHGGAVRGRDWLDDHYF